MKRGLGFLGVFAALVAMGAAADTFMPAGVGTQKSVYGDVLADSRKMTLYAFDQDSAGKSACTGACADVRPPLAAPRIGRPVGDWTIVTRDDGSRQWAYQGKPLYGFTGDHAPGDLNGDGGNWKAMMVGPIRIRPNTFASGGAPARAISSVKMTCSIRVAPRPPYSFGQAIPAQPAW